MTILQLTVANGLFPLFLAELGGKLENIRSDAVQKSSNFLPSLKDTGPAWLIKNV